MAREINLDRSTFAAGEISPKLRHRRDLQRQQAAVERAENVIVLVEGGLGRRSGTVFVDPLKTESQKAKMIPFRFAAQDAYSIVINGGVARFIRNGGVILDGGGPAVYEVAVPWAEADLPNLRWAQIGNAVFIAAGGYETRILTRNDHDDWTLSFYRPTNGPLGPQNLDQGLTIQASAATGSGITLTASAALFVAGDVNRVFRLDEPDLTDPGVWKANQNYDSGELVRNGGNVYSSQSANATSSGPNPPTHVDGDALSGKDNVEWRYEHSGFGVVRITAFTSSTSVTADVISPLPATVVSGPTYRWFGGVWSDVLGWPETVRLHDNRLLFTRGREAWMTSPFDLFDMAVTTDADSAIALALTSPDGSLVDIRWVLSSGLALFGTADNEISIRSSEGDFGGITTANARPLVENQDGSSEHVPALVDAGALFIGSSKERIHFAKFDAFASKIEVREASITARHILAGKAEGIAYQRDPNRIAWIWCADGSLIALTFMPEESVLGWSRCPMTNGVVEDVVTVPNSDESEDVAHLIVLRTIDGQTRRYIEILQPFFVPIDADDPTAEGAWFVDSGLAYSGPAVTLLSGLEHLEGQQVRVFSHGHDRGLFTVEDGGVLLNEPTIAGKQTVVGLPLRGYVKLLPFEAETQAGSTKGRAKRSSAVLVDVAESAAGTLVSNGGDPEPLQELGAIDYGEPVPLITGPVPLAPQSPTETELIIEVILDNAHPFTLAGVGPDMSLEEDD